MNDQGQKPSVLLIDDNETYLLRLGSEVNTLLYADNVEVRSWQPTGDNEKPAAVLEQNVDADTVLVATDFDLTGSGMKGLFGPTVVGWCRTRFIPVGDFSRANTAALPTIPELFELRIPSIERDAAPYIAAAFRGFRDIRNKIGAEPGIMESETSPAGVLSWLIGRPHLYSQLAPYISRIGTDNGALMDRITPSQRSRNHFADKRQILSYVLGHVLVNMVLKFPGPILSDLALCAYLGTSVDDIETIHEVFKSAMYRGPFADASRYYWREDVDEILDAQAGLSEDEDFETFGQYNRTMVERAAKGHVLKFHGCLRCGGRDGGFLCPFTNRILCHRSDCSVPASSWIPQGADICRIEREFFDEWAPILGF